MVSAGGDYSGEFVGEEFYLFVALGDVLFVGFAVFVAGGFEVLEEFVEFF